jgi:hypothetical protein
VHEDVWCATIWCDEAEALLAVEPLNRALSHDFLLLLQGIRTVRVPRSPPGEQPIPDSQEKEESTGYLT